MKTIKPLKLGLLYKTFEDNNRFYLATSLLSFFSFSSSSPVINTEIDFWNFVAEEMGSDAVLDIGMPKPRAEVLITGKFFSQTGRQAPAGQVSFELGEIRKKLYIFGDRFWKRNPAGAWVITEPAPMNVMDITYQNAFGGQDYPKNPLGKGFQPVLLKTGETIWPLPNIEDPLHLIGSQKDSPESAGFGPLDLTWPQRFSKVGTYDQKWLYERFPGYAEDMNWTFFNMAPEDQQAKGFFTGEETFSIENMHPSKPFLQSKIPGIRPRCFINKVSGGEEDFKEIAQRLDTLWLFPHDEKGLMIFRGVSEVEDSDADDVKHLLIAYEFNSDQPRPIEHYHQALLNRLDDEKGQYYSLSEKDLIPPGERSGLAELMDESPDGKLQSSENILSKRMNEKAKREVAEAKNRIKNLGLDTNDLAMGEGASSSEFGDIDSIIDNLDTILAEAKKMEEEGRKKLKVLFKDFGMDFDQAVEEARHRGGGRPVFSAEEAIERLKELGMDNPEMEQKIFDAKLRLDQSYRQYGHYFPPADRPSQDNAVQMRNEILAANKNKESLADRDFTGVDLSGLDLRGMVFKNAFLERANLAGCNLEGADFTDCVLVRANLDNVRLAGAIMQGANLGEANIIDTDFTNADLTHSVLAKAVISRAVFSGARLDESDLSGTMVDQTDFAGSAITKARFLDSILSGVNFKGADLSEGLFLNTTMKETDFSAANLTAAILVGVKTEKVTFNGANLTNLRTATENTFSGADFRNADLTKANLRGIDLANSIFNGADLTNADFSKCNLAGASLERTKARQTQFVKADLTGSKMAGINLYEGSLQKARLFETDLRGSNLYSVDFMRAGFRNTDMRDSLLKKVFLERWITRQK